MRKLKLELTNWQDQRNCYGKFPVEIEKFDPQSLKAKTKKIVNARQKNNPPR